MFKKIILLLTIVVYSLFLSGCFYIDLQLGEKQGGSYDSNGGNLSDATIPADLSYFP